MKKLFKNFVFISLVSFLFGFPLIMVSHVQAAPLDCKAPLVISKDKNSCVSASTIDNYQFLAPLPDPNNSGTLKDSISLGGTSGLSSYINMVIKLFIGICAVLAVVMIVLGGLEYMTSELIHNKEEGKQRITNAIFGLVLAMGAWTLLYTINPKLLDIDLSKLKPAVVVVNQDNDVPQTPLNGKYGNYLDGADWAAIAGASIPPPAGISVKQPECTTVGQRDCTSTRRLNYGAVIAIRDACPSCQITITGGTEYWLHSVTTSHREGNSTVDLRSDNTLNSFLSGGQPLVYYKRYPHEGGLYLWEGDHWHIGP